MQICNVQFLIFLFKLSSITTTSVTPVLLLYSDTLDRVALEEEQPYIAQFLPGIIKSRLILESVLQAACHINNTIVLFFSHIQFLYLMHFEITWVLVSSGIQVHPQYLIQTTSHTTFSFLMTTILLISCFLCYFVR